MHVYIIILKCQEYVSLTSPVTRFYSRSEAVRDDCRSPSAAVVPRPDLPLELSSWEQGSEDLRGFGYGLQQ